MNTAQHIVGSLKEVAGLWQESLGRWSGDAELQRRGLRLQVLARADRHIVDMHRQHSAPAKPGLVLMGPWPL